MKKMITGEQLREVVRLASMVKSANVHIIGGTTGEHIEVQYRYRQEGRRVRKYFRIFDYQDVMEIYAEDWPHIQKWLADEGEEG